MVLIYFELLICECACEPGSKSCSYYPSLPNGFGGTCRTATQATPSCTQAMAGIYNLFVLFYLLGEYW